MRPVFPPCPAPWPGFLGLLRHKDTVGRPRRPETVFVFAGNGFKLVVRFTEQAERSAGHHVIRHKHPGSHLRRKRRVAGIPYDPPNILHTRETYLFIHLRLQIGRESW